MRRYTEEERERLRVRSAPLVVRPFVYVLWLFSAMPSVTATIMLWTIVLFLAGCTLELVYGLIMGLTWVVVHAAWVFWLLLGAGTALVAHVVIRDAARAELRVRRSIAAKAQEEGAHGDEAGQRGGRGGRDRQRPPVKTGGL